MSIENNEGKPIKGIAIPEEIFHTKNGSVIRYDVCMDSDLTEKEKGKALNNLGEQLTEATGGDWYAIRSGNGKSSKTTGFRKWNSTWLKDDQRALGGYIPRDTLSSPSSENPSMN